ncbi:hypothetical protein [Pinirhizobacter soli]|uniref:hypothetical protein n=1 Tax=Pinirhizobacter soli TaxID=2786953 RepID=UPI00202A6748|nr:hypothetical protein [Pinirhizobacter soli]
MPTDTLITLSVAVAGLIAFAVFMGRWEKAIKAGMATADHFRVKGLEASIDRARHEVHIFVEAHDRFFRAPLGHLVAEHTVETVTLAHEKRPRSRCRIALTSKRRRLLATGSYIACRDWAETVWTAVETGKTWVQLRAVRLPAYYAQHWADWEEGQTNVLTDRMNVPLPNDKAHAFKLWLDHHKRELFPDPAVARATWDQTCAELLRACQQQRDHHGNAAGAFETWSFSAQPSISYLVIEADGATYWAAGDAPMLEPVERPQFKAGGGRLVVVSGGDNRSFPLPRDRLIHLRALQHRSAFHIV